MALSVALVVEFPGRDVPAEFRREVAPEFPPESEAHGVFPPVVHRIVNSLVLAVV